MVAYTNISAKSDSTITCLY